MRLRGRALAIRAILLVAALLLAGCAAPPPDAALPPAEEAASAPEPPVATSAPPPAEEAPPDETPTPAPEPVPPTEPTEAPPAAPSAPPPSTPPPTPPPPARVEAKLRHDFQDDERTLSFEVPAGAGALRVAIAWFPPAGQPSCTGGTAHLLVKRPDGSTYVSLYPAVLDTTGAACGEGHKATEELAPGAWNVVFEGKGGVQAWVDVATAS